VAVVAEMFANVVDEIGPRFLMKGSSALELRSFRFPIALTYS